MSIKKMFTSTYPKNSMADRVAILEMSNAVYACDLQPEDEDFWQKLALQWYDLDFDSNIKDIFDDAITTLKMGDAGYTLTAEEERLCEQVLYELLRHDEAYSAWTELPCYKKAFEESFAEIGGVK